jgi:hypothetical protein
MSEDKEKNKKIHIELDRSEELKEKDEKIERLTAENAVLKDAENITEDPQKIIKALKEQLDERESQLTLMAEKQLEAKAKKYGVDTKGKSDEDVIREITEKEHEAGIWNTAPLNDVQTSESGKPPVHDDSEFSNYTEMFAYYENKAKIGNEAQKAEAKAILRELTRKLVNTEKPIDIEIAIPKKEYDNTRYAQRSKIEKERNRGES